MKNLSVSDADIVEAYKTKAIKQICREMNVGINRVRAVLDKEGLRGKVSGTAGTNSKVR